MLFLLQRRESCVLGGQESNSSLCSGGKYIKIVLEYNILLQGKEWSHIFLLYGRGVQNICVLGEGWGDSLSLPNPQLSM